MTPIPELRNVEERSFWQATMPALPDRTGRDLPDAADVVVVGGGLTGLSAARRAAELGASVVLLEAERIGWGASTRNGGFCHPGFKQSLTALRRLHGQERAEALYRETIEAFEHVERLCTTSIEADFDRTGHLVLASAPSHASGFAGSVAAMADVGMAAHVVPRDDLRTEIGSDAFAGGMVVESSAGLHPGKLVAGLAARAEAAGAALYEETAARSMRRQADGRTVVETSRGALIAREVIVGTNGYTGGLTPSLRRRIMAISSFIIVTAPLPPDLAAEISPRRRLFFDTKNFLWYWRLTPDNRMLFGGRASMWPTSVAKAAAILQRAMAGVHPAAVADAGRLRVGRTGRVHVRPDGPCRARRRGDVRDRLLRRRRRGHALARDAGRGVGRRRRAARDRVAVVPAGPRAVRGPGVVPAAGGRVLEGEGPARRAGGVEGRLTVRQARRRRVASRRSMSASVVR